MATEWGFAANNFYGGDEAELKSMLRLAAEAEAAGFDSVWLGDHVLWYTPIVETLSLLSAYAATTERITVGTAILLLGLRQPGIAAKMLTSINAISGGRLSVGVGVGGENPEEFAFAGVRHDERGRLLDEGLRVLLEQWSGGEGARVAPIGPSPQIFIGGRSDATRRRIRRFEAGWIASFVSAGRVQDEVARYASEMNHQVPVALNVYVRTERDGDSARRAAGRYLSWVYGMEEGPLMRYTVAGTIDECVEQLQAYADAGVETFVLRPSGPDQREQLHDWATEMLPRLRTATVETS